MIREAHSPEISTCCCAHKRPGESRSTIESTEDSCCVMTHLSRRTRRRCPARAVRFLLEVGRRHKRNIEVHGVVHDRHDGEPFLTVRLGETIEILSQGGALAIRNAILSEVPWAQLSRHHFQRSRPRADAWTQTEAQSSRIGLATLPFRRGKPLPARLAVFRRLSVKT